MSKKISRRDFIRTTAAAGGAAALMPQTIFSSQNKKNLRVGFIGTGLRGQWMLWLATKYPDVEIPAICDIDDGMISAALKIIKDSGKKEPKVYKKNDEDFLSMVKNEELDGVYIATPWEWHHPMAVAAMKEGIHLSLIHI